MDRNLEFLKSDLATAAFGFKGQMLEASKAIEPILQSFEEGDMGTHSCRMSKNFRNQISSEIKNLKNAGLKRVIRITEPRFVSLQNKKKGFGFSRFVDASREWRECEIEASVLERYVDTNTGECVIENYDEKALITICQSRHIKASDQKKAKNSKGDVYLQQEYICTSCGANLENITDGEVCPYCGAHIKVNFFDWQLDSFYLDLRKTTLVEDTKEVATKTLIGILWILSKIIDILAGAFAKKDAEKSKNTGANYGLSAFLTVAFYVGVLIFLGIVAMPFYLRIALGIGVLALVVCEAIKYLQVTKQDRMKEKIVRFSDPYLRNCIYDEVWKEIDAKNLIDFSIDDVSLNSLKNTDTETMVGLTATIIKKYISIDRQINIVVDEIAMELSRARYPERKKNKGKTIEEKFCKSCGGSFRPDENNSCSYCGYGLKTENYIWHRV